jgi:sugar phosphate isomerase/epimerase
MRLGAVKLFKEYSTPEEWVAIVRERGYRAVSTPVTEDASEKEIAAYRRAAEKNDLVIAEVGIWNNPSCNDETLRREAVETCKAKLHLADQLGARCAVNTAGARTKKAGGDDLTSEAFERIVETVREIIDAVNPVHTSYCLEAMPWMLPDSVETYKDLVRAIDRKHFGVHCDPVNLINSPRRYFGNGLLIRHFFSELGPHIRSCHAKDIILTPELTVHMSECRPGKGVLDYKTFLREINDLDPDMPLMIEHLHTDEEYRKAADYIRKVDETVPKRMNAFVH